MQGYWNLQDRTAESLIDGWYASGDGGYVDEQGYLYLTGQMKDMIVIGGENVYPVEVEQMLRLHPAILEAVVIGTTRCTLGERVVAVIETRSNAVPTAEELIAVCRRYIADYKRPDTCTSC